MPEEKILAVDDGTGLLKLMKARLEGAGYRPALAATGDEAIALAHLLLGREEPSGHQAGVTDGRCSCGRQPCLDCP